MKDYESLIGKLTPDRKHEMWDKVKNLGFSNKTKYMMIYYTAIKEGYLSRK